MNPFPTEKLVPQLAFAIMNQLAEITAEHIPELKPDLPSFTSCKFKIGVDEAICIATIEFREVGLPTGGAMDDNEFARIKSEIGSLRRFSEFMTVPRLKDSYFDWRKLMICVDVQDEVIDWHLVLKDTVEWLTFVSIARAQEINNKRIRLALPNPPRYSLSNVQAAMWVLECEESGQQGTAFDLAGTGTVTNAHVVEGTSKLEAFKPEAPAKKFAVVVEKKDLALDLAIVKVEGGTAGTSLQCAETELKEMDHVAVCGFPNFRLGDSGVLSPGVIVGTRMKSGVRRLLTNAGIVAGMSGGPAIGAEDLVVGVCVTGSDNFQSSRENEDQSIIPISALSLLS